MKRNNTCSVCGDVYYRRNLTELWLVRNPGHRKGWQKNVAKVCLKCMPVAKAHRVLDIAEVHFTKQKVFR